MAISSVGAGSGILTQDVLDQLRKADETGRITPLTLKIANEKDKKDALEVLDAQMTNLADAIKEISSNSLFDERSTEVTGTAVSVTADANSDLQDITLEVTQLATKHIEESGSFDNEDVLVAGGAGQINLNIDGKDFKIDYDATTTLKELKNLINDVAGSNVDATLVNMGANDTRLFISSVETGSTQNITVTNVSGSAIDAKITSMTDVQTGVNAKFKFNGGTTEIERSSNQVDDLITGYKITLKEVGTSNVNVSQNRENIHTKIDSFVEKYNSAIEGLEKITKSSTDSDERGIFSNESIIKGMKSKIENMLKTIGGGVGTLLDYGFDVNKDGKMSVDKDVINTKLDENSTNFTAFFSGGTYTKEDGSTVDLTGVFDDMSTTIEGYTKYNAILDQYKTTITDSTSALEERKALETEKLDAKYEILKKQFIAYDIMISRFNSASSMFSQMITAQNAANN